MSKKLPAPERARILAARIQNLKAGHGNHLPFQRGQQIKTAEATLEDAIADLATERRGTA